MEQKYFIQDGEEKKGPFSLEQLRQQNVQKQTLIWYGGLNNWTEAEKLYELKSLFDSPPPPQLTQSKEVYSGTSSYTSPPSFSNQRIGKIEYLKDNTIKVYYDRDIVHYRYANFVERLGARILDTIIIILPALIIPVLPGWLYFALMHCSEDQQTLGQKAVSIKLLSTDGMKIGFGQSTGRFFANILNALTFLMGYLMFFFNKKNQCLHDSLASTIVVSEIGRTGRY